jgi:hypothetical protein
MKSFFRLLPAALTISAFVNMSIVAAPRGGDEKEKTAKEKAVKEKVTLIISSNPAATAAPLSTERSRSAECSAEARAEARSGLVTETRTLENFTALEVSGALCLIEVTCQQQTPSITITAAPSFVKTFNYEVSGNTLELSGALMGGKGTAIKITVPSLESVDMSGAQMVRVLKINTKEFSVDVSGACNLELAGKVKKLWIDMSGGSVINARDLQAEKVIIETCGASAADVFAQQEICASASGVSKVMYYGKPPVVRKESSGLGVIKAKD